MRKKNVLLLTAILLFSLLGCSVFDSMSMLSLPELSPEHAALAKYINAMTSDASWSVASPESGENRTAMQFVDFYGDGISEAVVFYKNAASLLLRICVYTKSGKASYAEMCRIDAPGDAFVFAEYVDLNGDGSLEMVAGMRYGSTSMYALKVYSLANNTPTLIADTTSSNYVIMDMDGDGVDDLLTAGVGESGEGMSVYMYRRSGTGALAPVGSAPLSYPPGTPAAVLSGRFNANMRAVVFESVITVDGTPYTVSDCVTYTSRGGLNSLSYSEMYGYSYFTLRNAKIAVSDVNLDGYLELPLPADNNPPQTDAFINWYYYDSFGDLSLSCTTYTNFSGENWYLICPGAWRGTVYSVSRPLADGLRVIEFITDYNAETFTLLKIYVLSEDYPASGNLQSSWFSITEAGGYRFFGELGRNLDALPAAFRFSTPRSVLENFATVKNGLPVFAGR